MFLRALAVLVSSWSRTLFIGRRPLRYSVAAGVLLLSLSASTAWGIPVPTIGPGWDGPGLGSADLTYYFGTPTTDLTIETQHTALVAALGLWSSVAAVRFSETPFVNQPRSIDMNFCHFSTCFPTQPGNVLAFAFFPSPPNPESVAGDIFFNDDFHWGVGNNPAFIFDLTLLGVHESGHSLGLLHSDNPNSVMRPGFGPNQLFSGLNQDDIEGILSLYAPAPAPVPEPTTLLLWGTTAVGFGWAARWRQRRRGQQQP